MRQIEEYFPRELLDRKGATLDDAEQSVWHAIERFIGELEGLSEEQLQRPLREGGWSPAQYADHLYRVHLLYLSSIELAVRGEAPVRYPRGLLTANGGLVTVPEGEPVAGRPRHELVSDLHSSATELVAAARAAVAAGVGERICHVNPYFGELTALGCLQMAAVHARHHSRQHLSKVASTA